MQYVNSGVKGSIVVPSAGAQAAHRIKMDKVAVFWILAANLLAGGMMYQRLDKMGYLAPIKHQAAAVFEPLLEELGLFHASYSQCGLQNSTMFIITSSRVVHPDGVRPGASKCLHGCGPCSAAGAQRRCGVDCHTAVSIAALGGRHANAFVVVFWQVVQLATAKP